MPWVNKGLSAPGSVVAGGYFLTCLCHEHCIELPARRLQARSFCAVMEGTETG